jgi:maltose-binding protein MalE
MQNQKARTCCPSLSKTYHQISMPLFVQLGKLLLLCAGVLVGCTNEREKLITIWTQMNPGERKVLREMLEKFATEHPEGRALAEKGYKFRELFYETETIRTNFMIAALGGSGPELVYGPSDMVGPFEKLGVIQPLENLFEPAFLDSFVTKPIPANTYLNGHLYQIGDQIGNHLCLVYNKALIDTPPKTMSELIEWGKTFTKDIDHDGKPDQYALVWNYTEPYFFVPFIGGYGGIVMNEKAEPKLNSEATVKAAQLIKDLRDKYKIIPQECDYNTANTLFKEGKAAMIINGPWAWAGYKEVGINFGVTKIPMIDETGLYPAPMISPRGYSINVNTRGEKLEVTCKLLKFLCSPEVMLEYTKRAGSIPARVEAYRDPVFQEDEILKGSFEQLSVGVAMPVVSEMRVIWDSMRPAYQAVLNGSKSPDEAAQEMQNLAVQLIKEMKE